MTQIRLIFEKQWLHAFLLAMLLGGAVLISGFEASHRGELWGVSTPVWFWAAVGVAITHQLYVWFCWRTQLHTSLLTRTFGDFGFPLYAIGFAIIGILRVVAVFLVAISNQETLPMDDTVLKVIAMIVLMPAIYLFYSVKRYFGFRRAFGIDHFDSSYRSMSFEQRGIFRFTRNGMYIYGFLLLWFPAFWWSSFAALGIAAFNHLYIWVHYYTTELPDIRRIYGDTRYDAGT
ncbi:MAG TPA: methyltransferase [Mariprofundaceae bacterium]|nr:methyltransferase [Mariprofundaceae bacterium]